MELFLMFENPYDILSPEEAMIELQIGKNAIYTLLGSGELKAFKVSPESPVMNLLIKILMFYNI